MLYKYIMLPSSLVCCCTWSLQTPSLMVTARIWITYQLHFSKFVISVDKKEPSTVLSTQFDKAVALELQSTLWYLISYWRITPCVSFEGGRAQVTRRLVELVFETCTFRGPEVGAINVKIEKPHQLGGQLCERWWTKKVWLLCSFTIILCGSHFLFSKSWSSYSEDTHNCKRGFLDLIWNSSDLKCRATSNFEKCSMACHAESSGAMLWWPECKCSAMTYCSQFHVVYFWIA